MARPGPDAFSAATGIAPAHHPTALPSPAGIAYRATVARGVLVVGVTLAAAIGLLLMLALAGPVQQAPELVQLLRGMVFIKGMMLAVGIAAAWWRLGRPTPRSFVIGYSACLGLSAAALAWLWGLALLPLGSAWFYGGLIAAFIVAKRDKQFFDGVLSGGGRRHQG
jgi:hypothetical protein